MLYTFDITLPKFDEEVKLVEKELELTRGVIKRLDIVFPGGCMGLVKARILYGSHPLLPANPAGYVFGDGEVKGGDYFLYLYTPPYALRFEGYNLDKLFDHTITILVNLLPLWSLVPYSNEMFRLLEKEEV